MTFPSSSILRGTQILLTVGFVSFGSLPVCAEVTSAILGWVWQPTRISAAAKALNEIFNQTSIANCSVIRLRLMLRFVNPLGLART